MKESSLPTRSLPRHIVLAVTGSIAAYKAAGLASELIRQGCAVRVILTEGAGHFVGRATFEGLTGAPVASTVWEEQPGTSRMGHLELARWADVLVVAPATAGSLARLAAGLADDLLGAVALATCAPLVVAPAMETNMWLHPAVQSNVDTLRQRGANVVGPERGRLASGSEGEGRMVEPATLIAALQGSGLRADYAGNQVLVTAGPTYEALDPIRFLGNRSSGKMGFAVATAAQQRGAAVTLVSGPTALPDPAGVEVIRVESAADMLEACVAAAPPADVIVLAAAVADFRPAQVATKKLKRAVGLELTLSPTEDIARRLAEVAPNAIRIGFALETDDLLVAARRKLEHKRLQLIVANGVSPEFSPFRGDANRVILVGEDTTEDLGERSKTEVANVILDRALPLLQKPIPARSRNRRAR